MAQGRTRGSFLIEAVIAVMMVATILAAMYPAIIQAKYSVRRSRDHYVATSICLATIEQARKHDYALLSKMAEAQRLVNDQGSYDSFGKFRRTVTVRTNTPAPGLTEVAVDVEVCDRRTGVFLGGREHMAMLYTTYLTIR